MGLERIQKLEVSRTKSKNKEASVDSLVFCFYPTPCYNSDNIMNFIRQNWFKILAIILLTAVLIVVYKNKKPRPSSDFDTVSFIIEGKNYSLSDVKNLLLPDGKTFYFGMPEYEFGPNCGSGGCDYLSFIGDNLTNLKMVTGYDKYYLDCDSNKISFLPDTSGEVFGSPKLDMVNKTIKIYYHLSANLGTENIYHIDDNGYPKLIASYDNTCSDKTVTLFRDSNFPSNLTEF